MKPEFGSSRFPDRAAMAEFIEEFVYQTIRISRTCIEMADVDVVEGVLAERIGVVVTKLMRGKRADCGSANV